MTKKTFESGDKIGRYVIDEFGGPNARGVAFWWVTDPDGKPSLISEKKLRAELARAEWTPEKIRNLSSRAYDELRAEIGEDGIEEILNTLKPQNEAPSNIDRREISEKWFLAHPQVRPTRANTERFEKYLKEMPNPTYTSRDLDLAFADCFTQLELNPDVCGISGYGEAIRGWEAIEKLTATQIHQLQKSFPVIAPVDFSKLSVEERVKEIGNLPITADQFIEATKQFDKALGIAQPVPPLLVAAREKIWANFFEINSDIASTEELKTKLLETLKASGNLPVLNQNLNIALEQLIKAGDPVVVRKDSNVRTAGGSRWVVNEPRPSTPLPRFDNSPVVVTLAEINAMDSKTYGEKMLNPAFRRAVDNLRQTIAG